MNNFCKKLKYVILPEHEFFKCLGLTPGEQDCHRCEELGAELWLMGAVFLSGLSMDKYP